MSAKVSSPVGLHSAGFASPVQEQTGERAWPPAPHDPRERELVATIHGWEIRVFGGEKGEYLIQSDLWHVQLWQPTAGLSVLTPSRLTCDQYEACPIAGWKAIARSYGELARMIALAHSVSLLPELAVVELERALVQSVRTRVQRFS